MGSRICEVHHLVRWEADTVDTNGKCGKGRKEYARTEQGKSRREVMEGYYYLRYTEATAVHGHIKSSIMRRWLKMGREEEEEGLDAYKQKSSGTP